MPEDEIKEIESIFTEGVVKVCVNIYNMGVLKHFASWGIEAFWNRKLCMNFLV